MLFELDTDIVGIKRGVGGVYIQGVLKLKYYNK
jgi:hypothetical protein